MITWGELKQFMEDEGIKEDQEIAVIELTGSFTEPKITDLILYIGQFDNAIYIANNAT